MPHFLWVVGNAIAMLLLDVYILRLRMTSFCTDTQEAPRSLSLESSSSVESLASIDDGDLEPHSDGEPPTRQHRRKLLLLHHITSFQVVYGT